MIQPFWPIAYSLMNRHDGSNSGLTTCSKSTSKSTALVPSIDRRAARTWLADLPVLASILFMDACDVITPSTPDQIRYMSTTSKRRYVSAQRSKAAEVTKARILNAAKSLFSRRGIDKVTIAEIAKRAEVAAPTVYALFSSKAGILRALMTATLFVPRFQAAQEQLANVTDPVKLIELTASVARAIYESESSELGLLRGALSFSPELRKLETEFEKLRLDMQKERIALLFARSIARKGFSIAQAQQILWMYTSRDVYRMLVHDSGWSPDQYQAWLCAHPGRCARRSGSQRRGICATLISVN
jgi:AcrR family transcriptional regulator